MTLTTNDRRVIIERGRGWEKARPAMLADVFGVSRQQIVSVLTDACAACGEYICAHTDAEWEGPHARPSGQFPINQSAALSPKDDA